MELPKNIVQIGRPDRTHKIFVEDYVVSYIKQLNKECNGKVIGLALYGKYMEENDCKYYFLYGASRIAGIEHRGPYLAQAEREEIEDIGNRYFSEYRFLAWCCLHGEPVEGFFVQTGGKGMSVDGYACFYEKNESMLNFMLMTEQKSQARRFREQKSEQEEKLSTGRGEWNAEDARRHAAYKLPVSEKKDKETTALSTESGRNRTTKKTEYMKTAVAAVFLILCVVGITTLNDYEKMEDLQVAARQVIAELTEQKLPDVQPEPLINDVLPNGAPTSDVSADSVTMPADSVTVPENPLPIAPAMALETETVAEQPAAETQTATENIPVAYVVAKGDTLISICEQRYGSGERLMEICEMNGISDANSIQIGQTILLP